MSKVSAVQIRPGTAADAAALTSIARQTFVEAYGHLISREDMLKHLDEFYFEQRQREELTRASLHTLFAFVGRALVGFAQLERETPPECVKDPSALMLKRLYVLRQWHGKGVAHALFDAVVETAWQQGLGSLWLSVWEQNPRAIAYYRKMGFEEVGSLVFVVGEDKQNDIIMSLDLTAMINGQA